MDCLFVVAKESVVVSSKSRSEAKSILDFIDIPTVRFLIIKCVAPEEQNQKQSRV